MIFGMTYYQICWYFLVYSFLGWVMEVAFHVVTLGKVINRGFLNGPVCPVYGFGAVSVFALINSIQKDGEQMSLILVFIFGVVLATLVELVAGWLLDVCFHARWWDYSNNPFNFHGYICLEFSIIWGLCIVYVVRILNEFVDKCTVNRVPTKIGWILIAIMAAVYITDFVVTVMIIQGFNKRLKKLDEMQKDLRRVSDRLSEMVGEGTLQGIKRAEEGQVQMALAKAEFKDAMAEKKANYEELLRKRDQMEMDFNSLSKKVQGNPYFGQGHLLKAFPNMKHRTYQSVIDKLNNREM